MMAKDFKREKIRAEHMPKSFLRFDKLLRGRH
jgi:hypothetical protein